MPRITSEQTREVNRMITRFRDLNVANAGSMMVTQVHAMAHYQMMMELMPLGLRASLLAWAGWPSAWGVMYDVAPAHISQRRYIGEIEDINELVTGNPACQNKIAVMMYLLKAYIIGSSQPMSSEFWPDFRRPSWMTREQKEDLVMYVQSLYQTRQVMEGEGTSREEELQAGAEPTSAEQMAFEMGAEEEESFLDSEEGQAFLNDEDEPDEVPGAVTQEVRGGIPFLGNYIVVGDDFMRKLSAPQPTNPDQPNEERFMEGVSRYALNVPEAFEFFNSFQNQIGDAIASVAVVRWNESQLSRYGITDLNNTSALYWKFSAPAITAVIGFPKTIMVVSKMTCPREAIGECPLNNLDLPTTIGDSRYIGTLQATTRYFHGGSEELRYNASAYLVGIYAVNPSSSEDDGDNQPTRNWIQRYNNYLNEDAQAQTQAQQRTAVAEQGEEGQTEQVRQISDQLANIYRTFQGRVYGTGAERAKQLADQIKCYVILRSLGASDIEVRTLFSQLYQRTLLPVDVTLSTNSQLREVYENTMKFVELKVMESQLGMGRAYQDAFSKGIARNFAGMTSSELEPLSSRVRLFRFTNTSRNRTSKLVGVQVLPILVNNRDMTRSQVLAVISGATTAARQMYLELMGSQGDSSSSSTQQQASSTATQTTVTAQDVETLGRQLRNRMIANRVYMFGMQTSIRGQLFSSGDLTITEKVGRFLGPAQDRSYIFYFAMLEENETGYGKIVFYQSEFGPLPYNTNYDTTNIGGVATIEAAMKETGRLENDEGLFLKKVPLLTKRDLRKFLLSDEGDLVRFEPRRSSAQRDFVSFGRTSAMGETTREAIKRYFQAIVASAERPETEEEGQVTQSSAGGAYGFQFVAKADMERVAQMSFTSTDFAYATFGYEYEGHTKDFSRDELAREMSRQGRPTVSAGYTHRDMSGGEDKIVTDCTVFPTSSDVSRGSQIPERNHFEFVTNIENSKGENGLEYLKGTLKLMQKLGARTDVTSGVHIHFGKGRWSEELKNNLCVNYAILEPWFKLGTTQWRREDRLFASAWYRESVWKPSMLSELASCDSDYRRIRLIRATREMRLNATCSRGGPTWEWRFPASCTEADVAEYHIRALYKLILISQYGVLDYNKLGKASHMEAEEYMESFLGRDIHTWWRNRMYDLATQSEIVSPNANPSRSGLKLETKKMFNNVLKQ